MTVHHARKHESVSMPGPPFWAAWSRANLAWVLGLILPLFVLSLHFKLVRIAQRRIELEALDYAELLLSDLTTVLAFLAVSLGLVAWAERHAVRMVVSVALQVLGLFYATVLLAAHGYFMSTGSSLDYPMLAFSLEHIRETAKVIGAAKSVGRVVAYASTMLGVVVLPWLLSAFATHHRTSRTSDRWLALLHAWSFAGLSLAVAIAARSDRGLDLVRDPLLNIALTMSAPTHHEDLALLKRAKERPTGATRLVTTDKTRKKNVVIVLLESTGAWATSLHGQYETTPFLAELGEKSIVVERMYAVEPHTSKALVSTLCGIDPRPGVGIAEALPGGILGKCLPDLLQTQGYHAAMFQSATREFENRPQLVRNMGFDEFDSGDQMNHRGLRRANYFGFEDRILLEPLSDFIDERLEQPNRPFLLTILTNTPHHEYLAPKHYGFETFDDETAKNRYLNAVRYVDFFLRDLMAKFERAGLVDDTIFLFLGDHGEGFGEHGRYAHDDTIYEEGLHIPFVVYDPSGEREPQRWPGLFNELDVVPSVLELLGLQVAEGGYVGRSLFAEGPPRAINAACYNERKCLARYEGTLKLIHHFGRQPDELFDLTADPRETTSLASTRSADAERMRKSVLEWYGLTRAMYRSVTDRVAGEYVTRNAPEVEHPRRVRFGDAVDYLGFSVDARSVKPGTHVTVTYHFRVRERIPEGYRLFIHGYDGRRRFTWDHVPVERMFPEEEWRPGTYVSDPHRIRIPKDWRSDRVVIRGGLWKPRAPRLRATPPVEGDDPVLAEVPVVR